MAAPQNAALPTLPEAMPTVLHQLDQGDRELDLRCLKESYPGHVAGFADDAQGTWLLLRDGRRVLYAALPNALPGTLSGALPDSLSREATVRQSMAQTYPLEPLRPEPGVGEHPGRVRSQIFLAALYGQDSAAVRGQLHAMALAGRSVLFSSTAGAADALARVNEALENALRQDPSLRRWVVPLGGTFVWRRVAGEQRLSPHSFGIAVDLNPSLGAYWRWSGGTGHPAQKTYPQTIVAIFEENGFVWGGKWREYDLMHFEYRPEIICKAKALAGMNAGRERVGGGAESR